MNADWTAWHVISVLVLGGALVCEALYGYCAQREHFRAWTGKASGPSEIRSRTRGTHYLLGGDSARITFWSRPWIRLEESEIHSSVTNAVFRAAWLREEMAALLRGVGRLSVATLLLARFAFGQTPPFLS